MIPPVRDDKARSLSSRQSIRVVVPAILATSSTLRIVLSYSQRSAAAKNVRKY